MAMVRFIHGTGGTRLHARAPYELARDLLSWDPFFTPRAAVAFAPAFDLTERADAFVLRADVPGVDDKDLDIAVHDGVLTVSGSRQAEDRQEDDRRPIHERRFGAFRRSFSLPETADGERIEAALANGVLTLTVAKKAEVKPRKIAIKR